MSTNREDKHDQHMSWLLSTQAKLIAHIDQDLRKNLPKLYSSVFSAFSAV
ncbi:MAG: hypothetical protein F6K62_23110 [Sphaerospermopsis sp. SIO1G2]|nr:hypothetical protein [Sphaerospermopsis sp. SIO1G1]NET73723.1 hypothetical protein [Sphaerospermopsis sp. SIO1G2]